MPAAGRFEVTIYYTCKPDDVGAKLQLSCGSSRLVATITAAHDPPETGADDDRFPRLESYVKEFKPLVLGTIELAAGTGELELVATEIPGVEAIDFRLLMLQRVE